MERIVVIQSYRTKDVPNWIVQCMNTVKTWSQLRGYTYLFYDDVFFDFAPQWYREKVNNQIHLVTDMARLVAMQNLLIAEYDRVVWIDADVVIFDQVNFAIPSDQSFGFGLELWFRINTKAHETIMRVHNAVMHFHAASSFLEYYLQSALELVKNTPVALLQHTAIGPEFLSSVHKSDPLPIWSSCALFSPATLRAISNSDLKLIQASAEFYPTRIHCANLCSTFRQGNTFSNVQIDDILYEEVIASLKNSRGEIINQFITKKAVTL